MNQLTKQNADKINELHTHIENVLNKTIVDAIEVGRLLMETKANLKHGEFTDWISANLIFTDRTARRYMKIYDHRHKLTGAGGLTDAYKMLAEPKTDTVSVSNRSIPGYFPMLGNFDFEYMQWSDELVNLYERINALAPGQSTTGVTIGRNIYNWKSQPQRIVIKKKRIDKGNQINNGVMLHYIEWQCFYCPPPGMNPENDKSFMQFDPWGIELATFLYEQFHYKRPPLLELEKVKQWIDGGAITFYSRLPMLAADEAKKLAQYWKYEKSINLRTENRGCTRTGANSQ